MNPQRRAPLVRGLVMLTMLPIALLVSSAAEATYSGTNGKLAFVSTEAGNPDVFTINVDGTGRVDLTASSPAPDIEPDWSPDGKKIVFLSLRDPGNPQTGPNREIYVMDADGSNQTRITNNPAFDVQPFWSPNGKQIIFTSNRDGNFELYVMNADGTKVRRLTNNPALESEGQFSPDGGKIVFVSNRSGTFAVYVMSSEGGAARKLTADDVGGLLPDWSPDGKQIALINNCCTEGVNSDVLSVRANGNDLHSVTQDFENNADPSWSPDGQRIAFSHGTLGSPADIYVMDADGSNPVSVTGTPTTNEFDPDWAASN